MNSPVRIPALQTYQLLLYRKALHPDLFASRIKGRRKSGQGGYNLEAWIMPGAHLLRFDFDGFAACELMIDQEGNLPVDGAVTAFPVAGEHDFDHQFKSERVRYVTSVQTETLSENLYSATFDEMVEFSRDTNALTHRWSDDEESRSISLLDIQRLGKEVHAQSYHLLSQGGVVIRTQTIFEHQ